MKLIDKNEYQARRKKIIEQAKAMEKDQIMDAHECGYTEGILHSCESGEEYYNKTLKSE